MDLALIVCNGWCNIKPNQICSGFVIYTVWDAWVGGEAVTSHS